MGRIEVKYESPEFRESDHTYWFEGGRLPGWSEIWKEYFPNQFAGIPEANLNHGRDVGKAFHMAIEFYNQGCLDMKSVSEEVMPFLNGYIDFKKAMKFKPILIETPVMCKALGYATKIDILGTIGNTLTLVEAKKYPICESHWVQMECQAMCFGNKLKKLPVEFTKEGKWKPGIEDKSKSAYHRSLWLNSVQRFFYLRKGNKEFWRS